MFSRALHAIEMPLAAVDELSDASGVPDTEPAKTIQNVKLKKENGKIPKTKPQKPDVAVKPSVKKAAVKKKKRFNIALHLMRLPSASRVDNTCIATGIASLRANCPTTRASGVSQLFGRESRTST